MNDGIVPGRPAGNFILKDQTILKLTDLVNASL
jgi:hypothetical protein